VGSIGERHTIYGVVTMGRRERGGDIKKIHE